MADKYIFEIVDGPSKCDLMFSLFGKNRRMRQTLEFSTIGDGVSLHNNSVRLAVEISAEVLAARRTNESDKDGSDEDWALEGWCQTDAYSRPRFTAEYSTKTRKGVLTMF